MVSLAGHYSIHTIINTQSTEPFLKIHVHPCDVALQIHTSIAPIGILLLWYGDLQRPL